MSERLTDEQLDAIQARYEAFDEEDPDCTCTRMDVDFYDASGCERCDRHSEFNKRHRHVKYMLELHGAQDIDALLSEVRELRRALRELVTVLSDVMANYSGEAKSCGCRGFCCCPGDKARAVIDAARGAK